VHALAVHDIGVVVGNGRSGVNPVRRLIDDSAVGLLHVRIGHNGARTIEHPQGIADKKRCGVLCLGLDHQPGQFVQAKVSVAECVALNGRGRLAENDDTLNRAIFLQTETFPEYRRTVAVVLFQHKLIGLLLGNLDDVHSSGSGTKMPITAMRC